MLTGNEDITPVISNPDVLHGLGRAGTEESRKLSYCHPHV